MAMYGIFTYIYHILPSYGLVIVMVVTFVVIGWENDFSGLGYH